MHVLVLESDPGAARRAAGRLAQAGHRVSQCHEPGDDAFPCRGLVGSCPLDSGDVDVVLTVRGRTRPRPVALEDGVVCGLRHRIPLVVAGRSALNPYERWATVTLDGDDDVVSACEAAAVVPLEPHGQVAADAAVAVLVHHDLPAEGVIAAVRRRAGRLDAVITLPIAVAPTAMITTRVVGALRALDAHARVIDVSVVSAQDDGGVASGRTEMVGSGGPT